MSTLTSSMQHLIHQITQHPSINATVLAELVQEAELKLSDLMPWSDFEHPESDSYGRQMVHDGGFFEVMVMSWKPEDFSAIHDHGHTQWGWYKFLVKPNMLCLNAKMTGFALLYAKLYTLAISVP